VAGKARCAGGARSAPPAGLTSPNPPHRKDNHKDHRRIQTQHPERTSGHGHRPETPLTARPPQVRAAGFARCAAPDPPHGPPEHWRIQATPWGIAAGVLTVCGPMFAAGADVVDHDAFRGVAVALGQGVEDVLVGLEKGLGVGVVQPQ